MQLFQSHGPVEGMDMGSIAVSCNFWENRSDVTLAVASLTVLL
jgi:hypothetical protein